MLAWESPKGGVKGEKGVIVFLPIWDTFLLQSGHSFYIYIGANGMPLVLP